jgi:hypothetical protein
MQHFRGIIAAALVAGAIVFGAIHISTVIETTTVNQTAEIKAVIETASQKQIEQTAALLPHDEGGFPFIRENDGDSYYAHPEMTYTRLLEANGHTFGPGEFGVMKVLQRSDDYEYDGFIRLHTNTRVVRTNNPLTPRLVQRDWNRACTNFGECTQVAVTVKDGKIIDVAVVGTIQPFSTN